MPQLVAVWSAAWLNVGPWFSLPGKVWIFLVIIPINYFYRLKWTIVNNNDRMVNVTVILIKIKN